MQLRRLAALALAVAVAACGRDSADGGSPLSIDQLRVRKISGDHSVPVPPPAQSASPARVRAVVGTDGYSTEPLVARVEPVSGRSTLSGPNFGDVIPVGTLVHWHLSDECGRLFGGTTSTDDSAYTANRWAPSTRAGLCEAQAGRILEDGSIVIDATWQLEILPGPVWAWGSDYPTDPVMVGDTIDLRAFPLSFIDAYHNQIAPEAIIDSADVQWAWAPMRSMGGAPPDEPTGSGWRVVAPAEALTWPMHPATRSNAQLYLWIDGVRITQGGMTFEVVAPPNP